MSISIHLTRGNTKKIWSAENNMWVDENSDTSSGENLDDKSGSTILISDTESPTTNVTNVPDEKKIIPIKIPINVRFVSNQPLANQSNPSVANLSSTPNTSGCNNCGGNNIVRNPSVSSLSGPSGAVDDRSGPSTAVDDRSGPSTAVEHGSGKPLIITPSQRRLAARARLNSVLSSIINPKKNTPIINATSASVTSATDKKNNNEGINTNTVNTNNTTNNSTKVALPALNEYKNNISSKLNTVADPGSGSTVPISVINKQTGQKIINKQTGLPVSLLQPPLSEQEQKLRLQSIEEWARPTWILLVKHASYEAANDHERRVKINLFNSIIESIPCPDCRHHALQWRSNNPVESAAVNSCSLLKWVRDLRNDVNKRIGKPHWEVQGLVDYYSLGRNPCSS